MTDERPPGDDLPPSDEAPETEDDDAYVLEDSEYSVEEQEYEPAGPAEGMASVIRIDRHDDVASVCGRIDTAPTYWVILHAPRGNRSLSNELGMRRLRRHAEDSGRAVAFATHSPSLASRARQVGIPAARTPEAVRWDAGGRTILSFGRGRALVIPSLGRYVQPLFLLAVVVMFGFLLIAMAPSARVLVYPETETRTATITITASTSQSEVDLDNLRVPAVTVTASRELTLVQPTTGLVELPATFATAEVLVTNPTSQAVTVPEGTVLLASPDFLGFEFVESLIVEPGEEVPATVRALEAGPGHNLGAGTVTGWLDESLRVLTVTNPEPASGGSASQAPAVTGADVIAVRDQENAIRTADATRLFLVEERPRDAVFLETVDVEGVEVEPPASIGTRTDLLIVRYRVVLTGEAIQESVLEQLARAVLRGGAEGTFVPGSVSAIQVGPGQFNAATGELTATFEVSGDFAADLTTDEVRAAVKGKTQSAAKAVLADRYGMDDTSIKLTPGFAPWMPRFDFRIDVEFRPRSELEPPTEEGDDETNGGTATPAPTAEPEPTPTEEP